MLKRVRIGLVAVLAVSLAAVYGTPAMAKDGKKGKAEVQYNCKKSKVKPEHIEVGCDKKDSRAHLRRVEYRDNDYGDKKVRGKADFSAGAGNSKVNLRFKKLKKCKGEQVYRRVTVKFKNSPPSGHSSTEKYKFKC